MDLQNEKCVMVIDENLPLGIIANTAAIMGITLGKEMPEVKLYQPEFQNLTVVDFSDLAQGCKTYDEFIEKMGNVSESTLQYFGLAICGPKKKVSKLTGSMPLLR